MENKGRFQLAEVISIREDVRRQNARSAGLVTHFIDQIICRRAVMVPPGICFIRDHHFEYKGFDLLAHVARAR